MVDIDKLRETMFSDLPKTGGPWMLGISSDTLAEMLDELSAKRDDIAELIECLSECEDVLANLAKEPNVNPWLADVRDRLAKHRPDAFARWIEGIEP